MKAVIDFIVDSVKEEFLHPARFIRKIRNHSDLSSLLQIPPQTASSDLRIFWDTWYSCNIYNKFTLNFREKNALRHKYIPELENLVKVNRLENWQCDIRDIDCLAASKSNLRLFKTLDDFAKAISHSLIADISEESLHFNLQWENGRILDSPSFYCYQWDNNRIHLGNGGGSHHFSAARYLAHQLNKKIPIYGRLNKFYLDPSSVFSLLRQFDLYSVNSNDWLFIVKECEHFEAPFGLYPAPQPYYDQTIIFLPRNNKRSLRISKLFKQVGIFDFGMFLLESLNNQEH